MRYLMSALRWGLLPLFLGYGLFAIVEAFGEMHRSRYPVAFFLLWTSLGLLYLLAAAILCATPVARRPAGAPLAYTLTVATLFCLGLWLDPPGWLWRAYEDGAMHGALAVSLALAVRLRQSDRIEHRAQARAIAWVLLAVVLVCIAFVAMAVLRTLAGLGQG